MRDCEKDCILAKRLKIAAWMVAFAMIACSIDVLLGISTLFTDTALSFAVASSVITLTIICIGYKFYGKLGKSPHCMEQHKEQGEALRLVFSKSNIVLSITDILVGTVALILAKCFPSNAGNILTFATGLNVVKTTKIAVNTYAVKVQIKKIKNFIQISKGTQNKRRSKMKAFFKWIFQSNPKTMAAIITVIGSVGLATIGIATEWLGANAVQWVPIVSPILGAIGAALAAWAGLEWNTTADARKIVEDNSAKVKEAAKQAEIEIKTKALEAARVEIEKLRTMTVPLPPPSPNE